MAPAPRFIRTTAELCEMFRQVFERYQTFHEFEELLVWDRHKTYMASDGAIEILVLTESDRAKK